MESESITEKMKLKTILKKCRYCQSCVLACSMVHEQGKSVLQKGRLSIHRGVADRKVVMTICRHCANPKCMDDCPSGAMSRDETGMVIIDEDICIACGNCKLNCPFGAIIYIEDRNKYQKCDLCINRKAGPACVEACPVGAIILKE